MHIREFQELNVRRCEDAFHPVDEWSPTDWACALGGEVGECLNEVKKLRRGDGSSSVEKVADELGDVLAYATLLAARLGIDLEKAAQLKFNKVSLRVKWPHMIGADE